MISTIDQRLDSPSCSETSSSSLISKHRRPSYVGLSKSVSGYSTLYKLTEGGGRSGSTIPVANDPQTLDAMRTSTTDSTTTTETMMPESSSPTSVGNLVQKQIQRLYGGKTAPILRSPPQSSEKALQNSPKVQIRTGELSPVFRLLRPEFREQLKMHSCTVDIPIEGFQKTNNSTPTRRTMNKKNERLIPIITSTPDTPKTAKGERIIPIERTEQPSPTKPPLPVKPHLESPKNDINTSEEEDTITSLDDDALVGGLRERELLCTIVEEDNESTASGYTNGHNNKLTQKKISEDTAVDENWDTNALLKKDGNYFIKLIENEVFKFEEQICDFEEDLVNSEALMNEDVRECILAAIGKGKLLIGQKLAQFRGLCDRNIHSSIESDPFVPTSDDLAGFWDMVYIQVVHIHSLFAELVAIRQNGWKKPEVTKPSNGSSSSKKSSRSSESRPIKKKKTSSLSTNNNNNNGSSKKSEAAKARDEARRKLMEDRKRELMRQKQQQQQQMNSGGETAGGSVLMII